jgi:hypothetical protein
MSPRATCAALALLGAVGCTGQIADEAELPAMSPATGESSGGTAAPTKPTAPGTPAAGDPARPAAEMDLSRVHLRRLTRAELSATLEALIPGVALDGELVRGLPDDSSDPFDNDESVQAPSDKLVASVNALAEDIATRAMQSATARASIVGCTPTGAGDDACFRKFTRAFGRRALRRPLTDAEVDRYASALEPIAIQRGDFYAAAGRLVSALLQDVELLYRVERGTPVPGRPNLVALDGFETASRLSFLLWGRAPDDALLDRAQAGMLATPAGRREAAAALLQSRPARAQIDRFHAMWIGYQWSLPQTAALPAAIRTKLRAESDALVERVVFDRKAAWTQILLSDETFLDDALAQHYGDQALPGSSTARWTGYSSAGRRGLLSHGSFLNVGNKFADTSPTQRGLAVRERLLCTSIPLPSANLKVNTDQPPPGNCKNDGYRQMVVNPDCAGCHKLMNEIGFGLERYDLGGKFRTTEPGRTDCPVSGDGRFEGQDGPGTFNGPAALAQILVASPLLDACLATQLFRFAQGRDRGAEDQGTVDALVAAFQARGRRLDELLLEIVASPSFAQRTLD